MNNQEYLIYINVISEIEKFDRKAIVNWYRINYQSNYVESTPFLKYNYIKVGRAIKILQKTNRTYDSSNQIVLYNS